MKYWIFKVNPDLYRIFDRLENKNPLSTWQINQHKEDIEEGDLAFIWVTGANRGIIACFDIESNPIEMDELIHDREYYTPEGKEKMLMRRLRVKGRFRDCKFACISHTELMEIPQLHNLSVFIKGPYQRGTNFPVTEEQGKKLLEIILSKKS